MGEVVVGGGGMEADVVVRAEEAENGRETDERGGSSEVVPWEKFLPRMVLRVLLVEADDSTRQIISALLRKCSYKVAAVPDGLMAWETLKGSPHNIDLILTEVELPSISGYALLTLVTEHDICKNIPVIMMSSNDSISMVLKCMLKGAADFLIKPVRRNELRNLWQHVWRRQTLTAGHIPQDSPYTQHRVEAGSENNSASDHSSECATSSRKRKECSDEGSDLQVLSPMECKIVEKEKYKVCDVSDEKSIVPDEKPIDRSTRIASVGASLNGDHNSRDLELGEEFACGKIIIQDEDLKPEKNRENVSVSHNCNGELIESSGGAIDLIGTFDDGPKHPHRHLKKHDVANKFEVTPELELSLTRIFHNEAKNQGVEGRDALNHSSASAFSWYNNKILQPLFPTSTNKCTEFKENVRETLDPSTDAVDQKNSSNLNVSWETVTNLAIGQSAEAELAYQNTQKLICATEARLDNGCNSRPTLCHPDTVQQEGRSPKIASQQEHSVYPEIKALLDGTAVNSMNQHMHQPNDTEVLDQVRHGSPASGYSRSSSISNSAADHTNSSAHGSFTSRSDGNVGFAVTPEKANVPESLNDGSRLFARDGFRGMDALRSNQREAALTKFRLKRKDRCYEKKVRYQSRKRLAEQRPRVKGQFVRQVPNDALTGDANC